MNLSLIIGGSKNRGMIQTYYSSDIYEFVEKYLLHFKKFYNVEFELNSMSFIYRRINEELNYYPSIEKTKTSVINCYNEYYSEFGGFNE